jgi:hypothetical protein
MQDEVSLLLPVHAAGVMNGSSQSGASAQSYARLAGALFLLSLIAGGFGEAWAPAHLIVPGDATATAANVIAHSSLFRWGFAAYLVEASCDIALAWAFYVLLKPVHKNLALLSAFFGLIATATFAGTELFYFAPSFILGGSDYLKTFTPGQLDSLALLSFRFYGVGGGVFMVFYGIAWILRGYLIYKSQYLPRSLGVVGAVAGLGFVAHNFAQVLSPAYASDLMLAPVFLFGLYLTGWLLVRGVNVPKWEARAKIPQPM